MKKISIPGLLLLISILFFTHPVSAQALKTPLSQDVLDIFTNEISGQAAYNNEVLVCGAPWIRNKEEFTGTFYESGKIYELVKNYGIETTRLERYSVSGESEYPFEGELWIVKPLKKLIARLEADPALVAEGSVSADYTGGLVYIPPMTKDVIKTWQNAGIQAKYNGKVALMWSHAKSDAAKALDAAGIKGVISFESQERYFDPDQVVYSDGSYRGMDNLKSGLSISWRQWSELFEDLQKGINYTVRCKTRIESFPKKFETVYSWIPGTEPDKKGVIFTAHLFEGYTKRGANDNMSGCAVQLEILRALTKLIRTGELPQPRRNIYFLWPDEMDGTYEFFRQHPGITDKWSICVNMDMVGEGLRKNNAKFTFAECPNHLPSYLDGLGKCIMNYVFRTNDIVYMPDSPPGRSENSFPVPMVEKNGSRDAFRYFIHGPTESSDHACFNIPSVAVPGVELNIWPDQWYHTDKDTPDKSDPTQMKRTGFIGAAIAYTAANCTDDILPDLVEEVADFGYERIAKGELSKALKIIENAEPEDLQNALNTALNLINFSVEREIGAVESISEIYSGSESAQILINNRIRQFELYSEALNRQMLEYAGIKAAQFKIKAPVKPELSALEKKNLNTKPSIHEQVKGKEFNIWRSDAYKEYLKQHPDIIKEIGMNGSQRKAVLNYVNGKRSITKIKNCVIAETGTGTSIESVIEYLKLLKEINWVNF